MRLLLKRTLSSQGKLIIEIIKITIKHLFRILKQTEECDEKFKELSDILLELMNEFKVKDISQYEEIVTRDYPELEWTIEIYAIIDPKSNNQNAKT